MSSSVRIPPPPRHSVDAHNQQACIEAGDLEGAEHVLRCSIARRHDRLAQLELSRVLFWQGRLDEALPLLEQLNAEREDPWCLSFLGQVLACFGERSRALSTFARALQLDPDNHEARSFLFGDALDQFLVAREHLTMRRLSWPEALAVAELCAAVEFKTGRSFARAAGPISQVAFDRTNILFDLARVGRPVERCLSLHERFGEARRVVFYTSTALGDSILGLAVVDALDRYFRLFPERRVPIEVVSPYAYAFGGLEHRYLGLELTSLPSSSDHAADCSSHLCGQQAPSIAITNAAPQVYERLAAARAHDRVRAVVDAHIDRIARGLHAWRCLRAQREIGSYPARIARFMEMVVGHKLYDDPTSISVELERPAARTRAGRPYHCLVESASRRSKTFCPEVLVELLSLMAGYCSSHGEEVVFCRDPTSDRSLVECVQLLPMVARSRIRVVTEPLPQMVDLLAGASSVVSTDTGLAHLAGALGVPVVVVFTAASPMLWHTGGANIRILATPSAWAAHANATPVNMLEWDTPRPLMRDVLTGQQVFSEWLDILPKEPFENVAVHS
jgi:tetratricopeptide (TPR) repeat protein